MKTKTPEYIETIAYDKFGNIVYTISIDSKYADFLFYHYDQHDNIASFSHKKIKRKDFDIKCHEK